MYRTRKKTQIEIEDPTDAQKRHHKFMKRLGRKMEKERADEAVKLSLLIARLEGERVERESVEVKE